MGVHSHGRTWRVTDLPAPDRGEVWLVNPMPGEGREPGDMRECLILSDDDFNHGPTELAVVLPLSTAVRGIPLPLTIEPPEGGLGEARHIMPEMIRSISRARLFRRLGTVEGSTLAVAQEYVRAILRL